MEKKTRNRVVVTIDADRCKGCGLCVLFCPRGCLRLAEKPNKRGIFPVERDDTGECDGCLACALTCPDLVFRIEKVEED